MIFCRWPVVTPMPDAVPIEVGVLTLLENHYLPLSDYGRRNRKKRWLASVADRLTR